MSYSRIDLKEAERRAFKSTFHDGIWDMYLGIIFLGFGLGTLVEDFSDRQRIIANLVYTFGALALFILGKKFITAPRIGYAKFGESRKQKILKNRLILTLSVVLGVAVWFDADSGTTVEGSVILLAFAANILVVFGFMAYYLDYDRLYIYAPLWALSLPLGELLKAHFGLQNAAHTFFVTGSVPIVIGMYLFFRFLKHYPQPQEQPNGNA